MCTLNDLSLSPCEASEIERENNKIATRAKTRTKTARRQRNKEEQ
jgi:hypothetical protein